MSEERGALKDIAVQLYSGVRDAAQEVNKDIYNMMDYVAQKVPGGAALKMGLVAYAGEDSSIDYPEAPEPDTVAGSITKPLAQFGAGFAPSVGLLRAAKLPGYIGRAFTAMGASSKAASGASIILTAEAGGLIADQIAFDPYEERLSNVIQDFPALENPVTEYLAADPEDGEAEARLKVAMEGAGLSAVFGMAIPLFRRVRGKRTGSAVEDAARPSVTGEDAAVSLKTEKIADDVSPEDILDEAAQGERPFVNNKYLDTPEDIKNTINAVTDKFEKTIDPARRGRISEQETKRLAEDLGMTVEQLTKRKKGQAFNAEQAYAARTILNDTAEDLTRLAKLAVDPDQNTGEIKLAFHKALARHAAVQEQVMGMAAEAGRALRQFQIPTKGGEKTKIIKEMLDDFGSRGLDTEKMAEMVSKLDTPEGLAKFARKVHDPKFSDMALEYWINSLLSGPTTQAVNVMSNTAVSLWTIPETALASVLGSLRKNDKVFARESVSRLFGFFQGAADGLRLAGKTFVTEMPSDSLSKIEVSRYRAIPSKTFREGAEKKVFGGIPIPFSGEVVLGGKQVRIPGRLLQAGDEFFKAIGKRQELNALAMRDGLDRGLSGRELAEHIKSTLDNPSDELIERSIENARYQTFTNELGDIGKSVQKFAAAHPALRIILPFIRTPTNIVKFAAHRSPLGFLMKDVKEAIAKGGASRDIALSRIAMGSAIGGLAAKMTAEGFITGGGPKDPALRSSLYDIGWQPYSLRIGDKYYAYSRFEPLGMVLGVASDATEIMHAASDEEADAIGGMVVGAISKNLTSKTWLQGISDLMEAVNDPDRYGENYIQKMAGTIVPTGVAQVARVQDPVLREVYSITDRIKSRIPGKSKELFPRRNVWGEPIELGGAWGPDIISPVYMSVMRNDPVSMEVARLNLGLQKPERRMEGVDLSPELYDKYVQYSGSLAKRMLLPIVSSPLWKRVPDEKKKDQIKRVMSMARSTARKRLTVEGAVDYRNGEGSEIIDKIVEKKMSEIRKMEEALQ